jgi:hypothetical protein
MARMRCVESSRRVGGWLSNVYEDDYIVEKDDGSCYKSFTTYEEAKLYQDYLQQQENQEKLVFEQKRTADETAALRKATEERNRIERERAFRPPFPPPPRQVIDPEYQEWLQFKKATDPEFAKWKREKEEAARRMEEARRRAAREAEQKRIADELARKKKEDESRRKKEEELRPYEDDILAKKKLPCQLRVKVAKETYREDVMIRCARDSAISVFNALKQNPNLTPKVRTIIAKEENPPVYTPPVNNSPTTNISSTPTDKDGIGWFGWFVILVIEIILILYLTNS